MLSIANKGQEILKTNYWDSELAQAGLLYLSGNAGAWRLLVPDLWLDSLAEMATARHVEMERSWALCSPTVALWFEDGTRTPFRLLLEKRAVDRQVIPTESSRPLLIYARNGLRQKHTVRRTI